MGEIVENSPVRELQEMQDQRDAVTFMLARMEQANDETRPWSVVQRLHSGEHPVTVFLDLRQMSRVDLATAVGTSATAIAAIENGQEEGTLRLLLKIAGVLRVDLHDLVPWPPDETTDAVTGGG
jgi:DNA-binding XRE family transcriptional regulator